MSNSFIKSLFLLKNFSRCAQVRKFVNSTPALNLAVPQPGSPSKASPKIEEIANSIAQLNLIEVAELSDLLKKKLNLPDAPMMGFAPALAAAPKEDQEIQAQSSFTVKLKKYDEKQKVALIKEIKTLIEGMNLVQAKKFVESAPVIVKADIGKAEADSLQSALTKLGAEVEII